MLRPSTAASAYTSKDDRAKELVPCLLRNSKDAITLGNGGRFLLLIPDVQSEKHRSSFHECDHTRYLRCNQILLLLFGHQRGARRTDAVSVLGLPQRYVERLLSAALAKSLKKLFSKSSLWPYQKWWLGTCYSTTEPASSRCLQRGLKTWHCCRSRGSWRMLVGRLRLMQVWTSLCSIVRLARMMSYAAGWISCLTAFIRSFWTVAFIRKRWMVWAVAVRFVVRSAS